MKYLFELVGEQPSQKVEVSGELRNAFNIIVKDEEQKRLVEKIKNL